MASEVNGHDNIPDEHHVARYCRPKCVQDDQILPDAFKLRPTDTYVSSNWMEYFKEKEISKRIDGVRKALQDGGFTLRPNGRFARLNVGNAKSSINNLRIKHVPECHHPSHAGIYTNRDTNGSVALKLANIIQPEDVFPAL